MPRAVLVLLALVPLLAAQARAGEFTVNAVERTDMKAVFGQVQSRDMVAARARLGGTIASLEVEEGTAVRAGDLVALIVDDKLALQLDALDARLKAIAAELQNAETELARARKLLETGVATKSRVDQLQTQADVLTNQRSAAEAERAVLVQQGAEGKVLAPAPGRVLSVPVTKGSVVLPGETVARIAGGGYFLRLSLPERHAGTIEEGDTVMVGSRGISSEKLEASAMHKGKLVKIYPELDSGRVLADVEVEGLGDFFVGERTLVKIPVGRRKVLSVPEAAIVNRYGVDYVRLITGSGAMDVAVIAGERFEEGAGSLVEILSGLAPGDKLLVP